MGFKSWLREAYEESQFRDYVADARMIAGKLRHPFKNAAFFRPRWYDFAGAAAGIAITLGGLYVIVSPEDRKNIFNFDFSAAAQGAPAPASSPESAPPGDRITKEELEAARQAREERLRKKRESAPVQELN